MKKSLFLGIILISCSLATRDSVQLDFKITSIRASKTSLYILTQDSQFLKLSQNQGTKKFSNLPTKIKIPEYYKNLKFFKKIKKNKEEFITAHLNDGYLKYPKISYSAIGPSTNLDLELKSLRSRMIAMSNFTIENLDFFKIGNKAQVSLVNRYIATWTFDFEKNNFVSGKMFDVFTKGNRFLNVLCLEMGKIGYFMALETDESGKKFNVVLKQVKFFYDKEAAKRVAEGNNELVEDEFRSLYEEFKEGKIEILRHPNFDGEEERKKILMWEKKEINMLEVDLGNFEFGISRKIYMKERDEILDLIAVEQSNYVLILKKRGNDGKNEIQLVDIEGNKNFVFSYELGGSFGQKIEYDKEERRLVLFEEGNSRIEFLENFWCQEPYVKNYLIGENGECLINEVDL